MIRIPEAMGCSISLMMSFQLVAGKYEIPCAEARLSKLQLCGVRKHFRMNDI